MYLLIYDKLYQTYLTREAEVMGYRTADKTMRVVYASGYPSLPLAEELMSPIFVTQTRSTIILAT